MEEKLIEYAIKAADNSYSPYSNFKVGASLLTSDNKIFLGCNIENASYSPSCCAERVAIYKALSEGHKEFKAIAIVGGKDGNFKDFCPPCGVCRQVLKEFVNNDFKVILGNKNLEYKTYTLEELLPASFSLED